MANNSVLLTSVVYFFCEDGKVEPSLCMVCLSFAARGFYRIFNSFSRCL